MQPLQQNTVPNTIQVSWWNLARLIELTEYLLSWWADEYCSLGELTGSWWVYIVIWLTASQLSKELLSLYSQPPWLSIGTACWVWLSRQVSPQPNGSMLELLSLALQTGLSIAQYLSVGTAESGSPDRSLHSPMAQHWNCWVWLSRQVSPQPNGTALELLSLALQTGLSSTQWLTEVLSIGFTIGMSSAQ